MQRIARTMHALRSIPLQLSIGAARSWPEGETAAHVLRRADHAMYQAKSGRLLPRRAVNVHTAAIAV